MMTRPEAVALTREMYGRWTGPQVRDYLAEHGVNVGLTTVKRWADPTAEDRRIAARDRARVRRQEQRILDRVRELQMAGVTSGSIATLLGLDFGVQATSEQVRHMLRQGRVSREIRKALS